MPWDPTLYLRFQREREQPFLDLLHRIPSDPSSVIDAGCGAGNTTRLLQDRWPGASVQGVDASPEMIASAASSHPDLAFEVGDLTRWRPDSSVNLVVSNAVLHWIPDARAALTHMASWLAPGGTIAVQVPANFDGPGHIAVRELAASGQWPALVDVETNEGNLLPLAEYAAHMESLGFDVEAWDTTYFHRMPDAAAITAWYEGTTIRPHLAALPDDQSRQSFLAALAQRIEEAFPGAPVWFPFKRRFFVARRPG